MPGKLSSSRVFRTSGFRSTHGPASQKVHISPLRAWRDTTHSGAPGEMTNSVKMPKPWLCASTALSLLPSLRGDDYLLSSTSLRGSRIRMRASAMRTSSSGGCSRRCAERCASTTDRARSTPPMPRTTARFRSGLSFRAMPPMSRLPSPPAVRWALRCWRAAEAPAFPASAAMWPWCSTFRNT